MLKTVTFNTKTSRFVANFVVNTDIAQPSVLYYNQQYYYQKGYVLKVLDLNGIAVD